MSLVILGTGTGGLVGAIAIGAVAGNFIEEQDASLTAARSELEFIAGSPVAATYDVFPPAPQGLVVEVALTGDETTGCLGRQHLQCVGIVVSRAPKATGDDPIPIASLVTFKARRFLEVDPVNPSDPLKVVPKAGGTTRQKDFPVPNLPPGRGFAIVISEVFATTSPSDILVQWHPTSDTRDRLKTVAVYRGRPFGTQKEDLTSAPKDVAAPLEALGQNKESPLLSVAATGIATGDRHRGLHSVPVQRIPGRYPALPGGRGILRVQC